MKVGEVDGADFHMSGPQLKSGWPQACSSMQFRAGAACSRSTTGGSNGSCCARMARLSSRIDQITEQEPETPQIALRMARADIPFSRSEVSFCEPKGC